MASRWVPLTLLVLLVGGYAATRSALIAAWPYASLAEFPLFVVLVPWLLWLGLRPARRHRARAEPPPWRKHQQVVRPLDDPARAEAERPLADWIERGAAPLDAARVVALAVEADEERRDRLAESLSNDFVQARTRRSREAALRRALDTGA